MNRNWRDGLNFFSKMTGKRAVNGLKVLCSYYLSKWTKKSRHWGMPVSIAFEPTTACNLRCPECPSGLRSFTRPTGMLGADLFRKTIDEIADTLCYLTFYFQGEPYLHPQFTEMVRYAAEKGIYTATSTNAHFLSDEMARKTIEAGLDRLIISLDGTTQEVYQAYRIGGKIDKVLEGTRNMVKWKKKLGVSKPYLVFQFLVVKPNEHQMEDAKALGKEIGVDEVAFKTAQIYDYEHGSPLIPTKDAYSRYSRRPDGTYAIKNEMANSCWKMWHSCVITWDGKVVPCCFDKDAHHQLGDLQQSGFGQLWKSEPYQQFREMLLASRSNIDMCRNCSEGTKVWG